MSILLFILISFSTKLWFIKLERDFNSFVFKEESIGSELNENNNYLLFYLFLALLIKKILQKKFYFEKYIDLEKILYLPNYINHFSMYIHLRKILIFGEDNISKVILLLLSWFNTFVLVWPKLNLFEIRLYAWLKGL